MTSKAKRFAIVCIAALVMPRPGLGYDLDLRHLAANPLLQVDLQASPDLPGPTDIALPLIALVADSGAILAVYRPIGLLLIPAQPPQKSGLILILLAAQPPPGPGASPWKNALRGDGQKSWVYTGGEAALTSITQQGYGEWQVKQTKGIGEYVFPDHLGTPFAWINKHTGATTYTPYNPWGELLATDPVPGRNPYQTGIIPTQGFELPPDQLYGTIPPIGLTGHLYDHKTGLTYAHQRYLSPRLGHWLTADFRAPNLYDPTTFTEPYAYAQGNPLLFWDPDGLAVSIGGLPAPTVFDDDLTPFILGLIESGATGQQIKLWSDTYLKGHMGQWTGALSESELLLYNALVTEGKAPATFDPSNNILLRQTVQPLFKEHYGSVLFHLLRPDFDDPSDIPSELSEKAWNFGRRRILLYSLIMKSAQAKASLAAAAGGSEILYQLNPVTFAWDKGWTMGSGESFISGEESSRRRALGEFVLALAVIKGISIAESTLSPHASYARFQQELSQELVFSRTLAEQLNLSKGTYPNTVFRGDARPPEMIFSQGFRTKGTETDLLEFAASNPPSVYVSTSISEEVAISFQPPGGYIYAIRPRGGVNVNKVLGPRSPFPGEAEIAIPGGITISDIIGARVINPNGTLGSFIRNPRFIQ